VIVLWNIESLMLTARTGNLTFSNSTFCPHSVFVCFVWIWEQTAIISLYNINWLVCITETECVYCAVQEESSTIFYISGQPPVGHGLLIVQASPSHSDTQQSVRILWTSDQPVAETSTSQHTTLTADRPPCPRRDSNPHSQHVALIRRTNGRRSGDFQKLMLLRKWRSIWWRSIWAWYLKG